MVPSLSRTQIDKLGDRLRQGTHTDEDLTLLDAYRLSFGPAYEHVVRVLRDTLKLKPTGRPAKSTGALRAKLLRESARLIQVQDIAGCRVVVPGIAEQDRVVAALVGQFHKAAVIDRRVKPSFGYRAVHVVVEVNGKLVELQVRTRLQHVWAELSEKLSDVYDPAIKYGGGEEQIAGLLQKSSALGAKLELTEKQLDDLRGRLASMARRKVPTAKEHQQELRKLSQETAGNRKQYTEFLKDTISDILAVRRKGKKP